MVGDGPGGPVSGWARGEDVCPDGPLLQVSHCWRRACCGAGGVTGRRAGGWDGAFWGCSRARRTRTRLIMVLFTQPRSAAFKSGASERLTRRMSALCGRAVPVPAGWRSALWSGGTAASCATPPWLWRPTS